MASFKTSTKYKLYSTRVSISCNTISAIGDTTDTRNLETNFSALINLRYVYLLKKKKERKSKVKLPKHSHPISRNNISLAFRIGFSSKLISKSEKSVSPRRFVRKRRNERIRRDEKRQTCPCFRKFVANKKKKKRKRRKNEKRRRRRNTKTKSNLPGRGRRNIIKIFENHAREVGLN